MDNARAPRRNVRLLFLRRPRDKDIIRFNAPFHCFKTSWSLYMYVRWNKRLLNRWTTQKRIIKFDENLNYWFASTCLYTRQWFRAWLQRWLFLAEVAVLRQLQHGSRCSVARSRNFYGNSYWAHRKLQDWKRCLWWVKMFLPRKLREGTPIFRISCPQNGRTQLESNTDYKTPLLRIWCEPPWHLVRLPSLLDYRRDENFCCGCELLWRF